MCMCVCKYRRNYKITAIIIWRIRKTVDLLETSRCQLPKRDHFTFRFRCVFISPLFFILFSIFFSDIIMRKSICSACRYSIPAVSHVLQTAAAAAAGWYVFWTLKNACQNWILFPTLAAALLYTGWSTLGSVFIIFDCCIILSLLNSLNILKHERSQDFLWKWIRKCIYHH